MEFLLILIVLVAGAFVPLVTVAVRLNWMLKRRARAVDLWQVVEDARSYRHSLVHEVMDLAKVPMQHAIGPLMTLEKRLAIAERALGVDGKMASEMALTDALADFESVVEARPPRWDKTKIKRAIREIDIADRSLDDARRAYNESAAGLNKAIKAGVGRLIAIRFKVRPLPYFHHDRGDTALPDEDDQPSAGDLPPPAEDSPEEGMMR